MTTIPGDQARVSISLRLPPDIAFKAFTEDINQWWRQGRRYRIASGRGMLHLEPGVGGRLYESFESSKALKLIETGRVTAWDPPHRLVFDWRAVNFAPDEVTEVEVEFMPTATGTMVTVTHRGWAAIRPDHPARHGEDVDVFIRSMGRWWGDLMQSLRLHTHNPIREESNP